MTTAHRATWKAARGGLQEEGSFRLHAPSEAISAKDAPGETRLKLRAPVQETREALRAALEDGEDENLRVKKRARLEITDGAEVASDEAGSGEAVVEGEGEDGLQSGSEEDGESSDEDSEDEAELLAELEKIRKERAFEKAKKQSEEQERLEREEAGKRAAGGTNGGGWNQMGLFQDDISDTASMGTGSVPAFAVRRRWDDDVLFRDQAAREGKTEQRFVNDTIRNDFHRRFMKRYMR